MAVGLASPREVVLTVSFQGQTSKTRTEYGMSGETGVQTASPSPNVAAEDVPEHPSDSDTETVTNETPTVQEVEDVDLDVPQVDNETKELNVQETTKLLEDEEMPTFTAISEVNCLTSTYNF